MADADATDEARGDGFERRAFLARGLWAAGAATVGGGMPALLAACGSGSPVGASSPATTVAPRRGGSLTIGTTSEIDGFDPSANRFDNTGLMYAATVFDALAGIDYRGRAQPLLAESIEPNADYTVWTIQLRPGVVFHDGEPLTADAVRFNLQNLQSSALVGPALSPIDRVEVTGPLTVLVSTRVPWVAFPTYLAGQPGFVASPRMLQDKLNGSTHPVGTGPFVFKEWVPNDHFTAVRNPHYWRTSLPYLDEVTYRPIVDQDAQEASVRSGGVDILVTAYTQLIAEFRGSSHYVLVDDSKLNIGEPDIGFIMCNCAVPPTDDVRVRRALAYATDKQRIINTLGNGVPIAVDGPFQPGSPWYAPTGYPGYDVAKARQLVAEYAAEKGPVSFELGTVNAPTNLAINQLVQQMWQQAGIQTRLTQFEQTQYILNALEGHFQAYAFILFGNSDPDANYVWWSTTTISPVGELGLNFTRNRDPQIQQALDAGRSSTDLPTRQEAYQTVGRRLGQDCPYIWIDRMVTAAIAQPSVGGFAARTLPDGTPGEPFNQATVFASNMWKS